LMCLVTAEEHWWSQGSCLHVVHLQGVGLVDQPPPPPRRLHSASSSSRQHAVLFQAAGRGDNNGDLRMGEDR
jgi:hypothetical protein